MAGSRAVLPYSPLAARLHTSRYMGSCRLFCSTINPINDVFSTIMTMYRKKKRQKYTEFKLSMPEKEAIVNVVTPNSDTFVMVIQMCAGAEEIKT